MQQLQPNTTLQGGKYRIERVLGQGGFGITYLARNTVFDINVAIKEFFMKDENERDGNSVTMPSSTKTDLFVGQKEKFKKEAKRMFSIKNDHVIGVHDLFVENGTAYYVMDYVDGENLAQRLKRKGKPMTEYEVRLILPQVLDALKSVHDAGIWHLDLKPANILLDKSGCVKLIDFGASKQLNAQKGGATTSTAISYTNGYAPREQMEQNYDKFGPWTDIYALGATLYNLLTNKRPPLPSDIDDDETEDKHQSLPFSVDISDNMKSLVLKLMKTNRKLRPQGVNEVLPLLDSKPVKTESQATKPVESKTEEPEVSEETILANQSFNNQIIEEKKETAGSEFGYIFEDEEPSFISKYWKHGLVCIVIIGLAYLLFNRNGSQEPMISPDNDTLVAEQVDSTQEEIIEAQGNDIISKNDKTQDTSNKEEKANNKKEDLKKDDKKEKSINDNDNKALEAMLSNIPNENPVKSTVALSSNEAKKSENTEKTYDVVDQMPSFPGGASELFEYLSRNIHYPVVAEENRIQGRVVVSFIVERDGSISNAKIIKSVDPSLDKEAMRVVRSMPRWIPGKQNGSAVRVKYNVPVTFRL